MVAAKMWKITRVVFLRRAKFIVLLFVTCSIVWFCAFRVSSVNARFANSSSAAKSRITWCAKINVTTPDMIYGPSTVTHLLK